MPVLHVTKNGNHICTVGSDDVWMFSASVWGDIWGPETSLLNVSGGGKRRPDERFDHLIWVMPKNFETGDHIEFHFEAGSESSPKGTVFDATSYLPLEPKFEMSYPPTEEDIRKLEARPILNASLKWSLILNGGSAIEVTPDTIRQHKSLSLMWTENHPEYIRVSLKKISLRETINRSAGEEILRDSMPLGSSIQIKVTK